ncbi:MAG: DUF3365 domain-containing protein [Bacteroidia bacterium]|nr:DUF3365 domain-containing protein [Bacteroidia bacterium]
MQSRMVSVLNVFRRTQFIEYVLSKVGGRMVLLYPLRPFLHITPRLLIAVSFTVLGCKSGAPSEAASSPSNTPFTPSAPNQYDSWRQIADSLTLSRQQAILQRLLYAAEKEGWGGAVRYCHTAAETLTFYRSPQFYVQRVALYHRNPRNALADSLDRAAYNHFRQTGKTESFIVEAKEGTLRYYRPIYIPMVQCLKCHGKREDLDGQALAEIRKRYPGDKAIGFSLGDLRGMWKVEIYP